MKTKYLLPNSYKTIGFATLLLALFFWFIFPGQNFKLEMSVFMLTGASSWETDVFSKIRETNVFEEIIAIICILSLLVISFSREKDEDEYIAKIRLESLVWATYINYLILILAIVLIYGIDFLEILLLNMFTLLIIFILRFNFFVFRERKALKNAK